MSKCGGCLCSHPSVVWVLWIHDLKQGRYLVPMDGSKTVLVGTASGVVQARTIKRLPPGERWSGSFLDEAQGSELTPNALEDDGGRVGIRAPVLQPHAAIPLPPLVSEFRQVRRAPLRRTDLSSLVGRQGTGGGGASAQETSPWKGEGEQPPAPPASSNYQGRR